MAETRILTFADPDGYVAGFADARLNLTITGAGDFKARLIRLKLQDLEVSLCCESLARIAHVLLPPEQIFLSFPIGTQSLISDGFALRNGDMVLHGRGESTHQRSDGACQWGLISLSPERFESYSKAVTGREIAPPRPSRILHPARADVTRFRRLFKEACQLAEAKRKLIECREVARALEQEMLHAIINCVSANEAEDNQTRHRHAVIMARFEEVLSQRIDKKLNMPALCVEIGVPERTLRLCCAEFLGVSPTRYVLLRRLNKARSALRRADPSMATVAEVARDYQFLELGRFAVTYRTTFGESPSITLQRDPQI
ncbi:helix-turn-helix transcriptional regulator [Bradyrhizobium sp. LB11.1]|jgi:AraC-like DNA-binding protein|uniref:helix-turn-helix transcriptional regulator n=1 Tax=Bradyrhizobium sp. LB11.1 TaxID=3156326 RepID=UPI00339834E1